MAIGATAKKSARCVTRYLNSSALNKPWIVLGAASALVGPVTSAHALDASTLPQDPTLAGGNATFAQSGKTLNVTQTSNRAVIDWRSFNIGSQAQTNFNQPNSGSIAVNRVNASANPTQIEGGLHANGQVWILNPNGVMFGKTAHVDAAGIVASTANIDTTRFMAGDNRLNLTGADKGSVVNDGSITVGKNGLAAFVAPSVRNSGTITARVGKVALAAGTTFTLDLAGDRLVEIGLGAGKAVVDQSGKIVNAGGTVTLTARAAGQVVDSVVNMSGVTRTASARKVGGDIVLDGDTVNVAGTADASGTSGGNIAITGKTINVASSAVLRSDAGSNGDGGSIKAVAAGQGTYAGSYSAKGGSAGGNGGNIETSGKTAHIDSEIKVNTLAANGKVGNWTLDPDDLTIVSGANAGSIDPNNSTVTNGTIQGLLATTGVTLAANNSITVNAAIDTHTQTSSTILTLNDQNSGGLTVNLNAPITLGVSQRLAGQGTLVNVASTGLIQNGIDVALAGATVNVDNGTYVIPGTGGNWLEINKSLSLIGQSRAGTIIDGSGASGYGMRVEADNVTLSNFTLLGATGAGNFGLKVQPVDGSGASSRINNFNINNVTINGSYKSALDITAATNATIDHVTAENATHGVGIAIVDSANVALTNSTTLGNAWGGMRIEEKNAVYNQQTTGISVAASNTFHEATPLYMEDDSASLNFGAVNIAGFNYAIGDASNASNLVTVFQNTTQQGALDYAAARNAASTSVQGWTGTAGSNIFTVGTSSGGAALSINSAIRAANSGATINILPGSYTEGVTNVDYLGNAGSQTFGLYVYKDNITLQGVDGSGNAITNPTSAQLPVITAAYQSGFGTQNFISGNNVTIQGVKFLPNTAGNNKLVEVIGDNFTLKNSVLDGRGTTTSIDFFMDDFQLGGGRPLVENFTIQNSIFYGSTSATTIVIVADGTGRNTDASHRQFTGNSLIGAGVTGQRGLGIQGQNIAVGPVTVLNNSFAAVDVPIRTKGMLTQNIDFGSVFANNNFTDGAVTVFAADGVTAQQGLAGGIPEYKIFSTLQGAFGFEGLQSGDVVRALNGTYAVPSTLTIDKSITLVGQSQAGTIFDAWGATTYGLRVQADNVILSNFTLMGPTASGGYGIKVEPLNLTDPTSRINNFAINNVTINGSNNSALDLNGARNATINAVTAKNAAAGVGIAIVNSSNVTVTNSTTLNNAAGGVGIEQRNETNNQQTTAVSVDATNTFNETVPLYMEDGSPSLDFGTVTIGGLGFIVRADAVKTYFQKDQQGAVDYAANLGPASAYVEGWSGSAVNNIFTIGISSGGTALSLQSALNAATTGATVNMLSGSYAGNIVGNGGTNFNFGTVSLGGSFTLNGAATLSGNLSASSIALNGAVTLAGATSLNTSAANGSIVSGAINGSTAGGQALSVNAGSGQVSLGSLGAGTRLGTFTDASATTLTGGTYNADSLNFAGDVTLTASTTTMDTSQAAGDITVSGHIFGTANGAQNLVLTAGPGAGNAAANGNILLQSVGVKGPLALGDLTISGNNFGAQTVSVGNFKAKLTGNQVFSSHTLNATSVDSTVGGSASGPINSAGSVGLAVTGDVTGAIVGHDVILNAGSITGATITGTDNISITANSVGSSTLSAPTVSAVATNFDSDINATNVMLNAGTISGSTITGSQNITITANTVGSSSFTAPTVAATAANFDSIVNASNGANISGGTIAGTFTGGSITLTGSTSVNAKVSANSTTVSSRVISGSYSGDAVSLSGSTSVNATVASNSLSVQSPSGTLTGTWASLDTGTSGTLVVNNQVSVGSGNINPNQIVVENFVLPSGTFVTTSGDIILPQSLMIALLSPGGGANSVPKLIQVQDVYNLGALLASGYTAIIIDLSGTKKPKDKKVRLSMN